MTAKSGDEFDLDRMIDELSLPSIDLISLFHPTVDHHLLQRFDLPVLVTCNPLGPGQEFIQHQRTKARHMQAGALLQRKTAQRIAEAEEMEVNQSISVDVENLGRCDQKTVQHDRTLLNSLQMQKATSC